VVFPGPLPTYDPPSLNTNTAPEAAGGRIFLHLTAEQFVTWFLQGETVGLIIREGERTGSQPGLIGFASGELTSYDLIDRELVGTTVGVTIQVEFNENVPEELRFLSMKAVADVSSLNALDAAPASIADGMMVRTYVRSYPLLLFDFSALPANVQINRARLLVANDKARAYGPSAEGLVVGELDTNLVSGPAPELTLAQVAQNVFVVTGQNSLVPEQAGPMAFNVTESVQRYVNTAYEGTRGFLLFAGESFTPYQQSLSITPSTVLQRFWLQGSDAAVDSLRPQLRISYTRVNAITEEGP
jgi:hypothetical protein